MAKKVYPFSLMCLIFGRLSILLTLTCFSVVFVLILIFLLQAFLSFWVFLFIIYYSLLSRVSVNSLWFSLLSLPLLNGACLYLLLNLFGVLFLSFFLNIWVLIVCGILKRLAPLGAWRFKLGSP